MKLFLKGKMFASLDSMTVTGENGETLYILKRDSSGDKHKHTVTLSSPSGVKIADIVQGRKGGRDGSTVIINGKEAAVVQRKSSFQPHYTVKGPDWEVSGSVFSTKYKVTKGDKTIANLKVSILKSEIDIADGEDPIYAVPVVMAIRLALYFASVAGSTVTVGV